MLQHVSKFERQILFDEDNDCSGVLFIKSRGVGFITNKVLYWHTLAVTGKQFWFVLKADHGCLLFSLLLLKFIRRLLVHLVFIFKGTLGNLFIIKFYIALVRTFLPWSIEELLWVTINFVFSTPVLIRLWPFWAFNWSDVQNISSSISDHFFSGFLYWFLLLSQGVYLLLSTIRKVWPAIFSCYLGTFPTKVMGLKLKVSLPFI